jgi:hypothetical protein
MKISQTGKSIQEKDLQPFLVSEDREKEIEGGMDSK